MTGPAPTSSAVYARLAGLSKTLKSETNRNELVSLLIAACIEEGITSGASIRRTLQTLGFNGQHVSIMLREGPKGMPPEHRWTRDETGKYRLP